MSDYKELIEELKRNGLSNGSALGHHSGLCDEAADAIEQLVKERDAAVSDLEAARGVCHVCRHRNACGTPIEDYCDGENWEWRGVQE